MQTKAKLFRFIVILSVGLFLAVGAAPAISKSVQASSGTSVTKIWVNGRSVDAFLYNSATGATGFVNVSQNETTNTFALDFSYSERHPTDPNLVYIFQGADVIPSTTVAITDTSAHLALTTPPSYFVNFCIFDLTTFEATCVPGEPLTFDLTWQASGILSIFEKSQRVETFGPVITKTRAEYEQRTAIVNGVWGANTGTDMAGNLLDTQHKSFLREITLNVTP